MLLLVDFLGSLNFLTGLRMFLLHITTTWPYLHPLLPGLYYFLLSSTTAVWEKISTSNASKCLENFSSYIALITLCLSALAYFFSFMLLYGIYILDMRSISVFGSSANVLVISTENNLLTYFPNLLLLVFYWVPLTKKLERSESNLSGKWNKCGWRKKICVEGHLYQTIGALVMRPGRVHALIKQIKQWDFELVPSGYNFYWHVQWVMRHLLCTNDEQHFHVHKQGDFENRCMTHIRNLEYSIKVSSNNAKPML